MAENATGPSTLGVTSTSQTIPARNGRRKLLIQNPSGSGVNLLVAYGDEGQLAGNSFVVTPGGTFDEQTYDGSLQYRHGGAGTVQMPYVEIFDS